jgi:hypothetical protein
MLLPLFCPLENLCQPIVPVGHPLAGLCRDRKNLDFFIEPAGVRFRSFDIEIDMTEQVRFVDKQRFGFCKNGGLCRGLVVTFGDRKNDYFSGLAKLERGRTNQVADVLDED